MTGSPEGPEARPGPTDGSGSRAPLVVFAGMVGIGIVAVTIVLVSHCQRDEPYLDSDPIQQGTVDRVPPPPPSAGD